MRAVAEVAVELSPRAWRISLPAHGLATRCRSRPPRSPIVSGGNRFAAAEGRGRRRRTRIFGEAGPRVPGPPSRHLRGARGLVGSTPRRPEVRRSARAISRFSGKCNAYGAACADRGRYGTKTRLGRTALVAHHGRGRTGAEGHPGPGGAARAYRGLCRPRASGYAGTTASASRTSPTLIEGGPRGRSGPGGRWRRPRRRGSELAPRTISRRFVSPVRGHEPQGRPPSSPCTSSTPTRWPRPRRPRISRWSRPRSAAASRACSTCSRCSCGEP